MKKNLLVITTLIILFLTGHSLKGEAQILPRELPPPIPLKIEEIKIISSNIANYLEAVENIEYYQIYSDLLIDEILQAAKSDYAGIRVKKGLYTSFFKKYQNQIIRFIDTSGKTKEDEETYLVFDKDNICTNQGCDYTNLLTSGIPRRRDNSMNDSSKCSKNEWNYKNTLKSIDTITSVLIPKNVVFEAIINNGISFIKLYNGIIDGKKGKERILYVLSYDKTGNLVIGASFSLGEDYLCPNYCDKKLYLFSKSLQSK